SVRGRSERGFCMTNIDSRKLRTAKAPAPYPRPLAAECRVRVLRWCWRLPAAAVTTAVTLAACSSFGGLTGDSAPPAPTSTATAAPASSNASFTSRVKAFFSGDSGNLNSPTPQSAAGGTEIECPSVEYRQGAATLAVNNPGAENTALSLRY